MHNFKCSENSNVVGAGVKYCVYPEERCMSSFSFSLSYMHIPLEIAFLKAMVPTEREDFVGVRRMCVSRLPVSESIVNHVEAAINRERIIDGTSNLAERLIT